MRGDTKNERGRKEWEKTELAARVKYHVYVHESPVALFVEPRDDRQFHQNTSPDHNNNKSETTISFCTSITIYIFFFLVTYLTSF